MPLAPADADRADAERVLAGDLDAFAGIVERWQRPLINLAYRFCRDPARAEDLAQEAFMKAFRNLRQWRGDAAFSTWLFAVALNVYRSSVRPWREVGADDGREPRAPGDVLDSVVARDMDESIRRAVLTLPSRYRDAIIMFYFREQELADAARCLSVAEGTLKARLHRARAMLKDKLTRAGRDASGGER